MNLVVTLIEVLEHKTKQLKLDSIVSSTGSGMPNCLNYSKTT